MSYVYSIFGLGLSSNLSIPGVIAPPVTANVDVQVWLGLIPPWLVELRQASDEKWFISPYQDEDGEPALTVWKLAGGAYFRLLYNDKTEFILDRAGARVWATWPDSLTLDDTTTYLLGPVLGFALRLRGVTCLHASAVTVDHRVIAFLGEAGAGKSTIAAAFAERGYPVLSDDIVPLWDRDGTFHVQPGYPYLRLWPSSVDALYGPERALPRLTPTWDKRYLDLTQNEYRFQQEPLPLAAIYILHERCADAAAPLIQTIPAKEGLMALVANTYATSLLDKTRRAQEFELLGRVAAAVPLRQVTSHTDPSYLSMLCEVILDDFQTLTPSTHALTGTIQA